MAKHKDNDLTQEIAYVKALAEDAGDVPLVRGGHYIIWGVVIAIAATSSYFRNSGALPLPFVGGSWFWAGALFIALPASLALGAKAGLKPLSLTGRNRTANAA